GASRGPPAAGSHRHRHRAPPANGPAGRRDHDFRARAHYRVRAARRTGAQSRFAFLPPAADRARGGSGITMEASPKAQRSINMWRFNWRLITYRPWPYIVYSFFRTAFFVLQVVPGLIEKSVFDMITGAAPVTIGLWGLIALYIGIELARQATSFGEIWAYYTFLYTTGALLRFNLFASILRRPGAKPFPVAVGDAINRFQNDVTETADFPMWLPY